MAYVKVGNHKSASACLTYGERKDGEDRVGIVVGSVNCSSEFAKQEFSAVRIMWRKEDGIQAHTVIQSFDDSDNITLEQANKLGMELARRLAVDYQAVVFTHNDGEGGKIHNHIVINAVNPKTGKKLDTSGLLNQARNLSNEISKENGLSVIEDNKAKLRYTQAEAGLAKKGETPWKDDIRQVVELAMSERTLDDFKAKLEAKGVKISERYIQREGGTVWTYEYQGKKVRSAKLGEDYTKTAVMSALEKEKATDHIIAVANIERTNRKKEEERRVREELIKAEEERKAEEKARKEQEEKKRLERINAEQLEIARLSKLSLDELTAEIKEGGRGATDLQMKRFQELQIEKIKRQNRNDDSRERGRSR